MRIEKYQVNRTEEYEGGRQKITQTRYRILDNEGKVIDDAQGTATNPPRRRESPTGITSLIVSGKPETKKHESDTGTRDGTMKERDL